MLTLQLRIILPCHGVIAIALAALALALALTLALAFALALALGPCQPLSALVLVLALKSTLVLHRHNMFGWTRSLNHDITSYHSGSDLPQNPETKNQPPT